jgi:hypothetical protein
MIARSMALALVFAGFLQACQRTTPFIADGCVTEGSEYYNNARTRKFVIGNDEWGTREVLPPASTATNPFENEEVGGASPSCGDESHKCALISSHVFAVPRSELAVGASYEIEGASFRVIQCYRRDGDSCRAALIESRCPTTLGEFCEEAGTPTEDVERQLTYFIYNEAYGVVAFGWPRLVQGVDGSAEQLAGTYRLAGDCGMLRN